MSTFSKQVAEATRTARAEAKRLARKPALLKHHAVKDAFDLIPLNLRKHATVALSGFTNTVMINVMLLDLDSFKDKKFTNLLERFIDWGNHDPRLHLRRTQQRCAIREDLCGR